MKNNYEIVYVDLDELQVYENNARLHDGDHIEQIKNSILEFGFTTPLLIDENKEVIAGHGRLLGAQAANLESVPCVIVTGLSAAQQKALVIADNQIALNATWDIDILRLEVDEIISAGFNIDVIAFDDEMLENLEMLDVDIDDGFDDEDEKDFDDKANVTCVIGIYRFVIDRNRFDKWENDLREKYGFDKEAILVILQKKLGLL